MRKVKKKNQAQKDQEKIQAKQLTKNLGKKVKQNNYAQDLSKKF